MIVLKYWREILLGVIVAALVGFAIWVRGIIASNTAMKLENKQIQAQFNAKVQELDNMIKLNKDIANAIKNIKIKSNNYISSVEESKPPVIQPGGSFVLIPGGMPKAMPGVFAAHTSARGDSTSASGSGDVQPEWD